MKEIENLSNEELTKSLKEKFKKRIKVELASDFKKSEKNPSDSKKTGESMKGWVESSPMFQENSER